MSWSWVVQLRMSRKHKARRYNKMGKGKSKDKWMRLESPEHKLPCAIALESKSLFSAFTASMSGLQHHEKPVTLIFREPLDQRFSLGRVFA